MKKRLSKNKRKNAVDMVAEELINSEDHKEFIKDCVVFVVNTWNDDVLMKRLSRSVRDNDRSQR